MRTKDIMTADEFIHFRTIMGLDQHQIAELLGVTYQAVYFWENGQRSISVTTVRLLRLFNKFPQLLREF